MCVFFFGGFIWRSLLLTSGSSWSQLALDSQTRQVRLFLPCWHDVKFSTMFWFEEKRKIGSPIWKINKALRLSTSLRKKNRLKGNASSPNHLDISKNSGTPKSTSLTGFSIINHPFWCFPSPLETPIYFQGQFVRFNMRVTMFPKGAPIKGGPS